MTTRTMTSREFNQNTAGAKRAAATGPVYITDRGQPSHVLLTFETYAQLVGSEARMTELLAAAPGTEDIVLEIHRSRQLPRAADFD